MSAMIKGKINLGENGFTLPMPVAILGTMYQGRPNFMTVAWCSRVGHTPAMVMAAVNAHHATHEAISACGVFSLNFPDEGMVAAVDYVGLVSGRRTDKSTVFDVVTGELPDAPLVATCPYALECRVTQRVALPNHTMFVGEIAATWAEEACLTDGVPDLAKMRPIMLSMPDNRYWSVGDPIGHAWRDGKTLKGGGQA